LHHYGQQINEINGFEVHYFSLWYDKMKSELWSQIYKETYDISYRKTYYKLVISQRVTILYFCFSFQEWHVTYDCFSTRRHL